MKTLFVGVALAAATVAVASPVRAQAPQVAVAPPAAAYSSGAYPSYPFAPTPEDAYKDGLITRWEFQSVAGPLPPALQGPPADSNRSNGGGDKGE